jgi:hypothetical protein
LHCTARATFIGSQFQILRAIELARQPRLDKPKVLFWMRSKLPITFANNGVGVSIVDQTKREGPCDVAHRFPTPREGEPRCDGRCAQLRYLATVHPFYQ